jgi:hypothetical protein
VHGDIFASVLVKGKPILLLFIFMDVFFTTNFDANDRFVHATNVGVCPKD